MRSLLSLLAVITLFTVLPTEQAKAQTVAKIIKGSWKGTTTFATKFVQDGTGTLTQTLTIDVYAGTNVSGKMISVWVIDGVKYKCQYTISGKVNEENKQISFHSTVSPGGDYLPKGMEWCSFGADLTLYTDPKHPGYYILSGVGKEKCNWGAATLTYSNY